MILWEPHSEVNEVVAQFGQGADEKGGGKRLGVQQQQQRRWWKPGPGQCFHGGPAQESERGARRGETLVKNKRAAHTHQQQSRGSKTRLLLRVKATAADVCY